MTQTLVAAAPPLGAALSQAACPRLRHASRTQPWGTWTAGFRERLHVVLKRPDLKGLLGRGLGALFRDESSSCQFYVNAAMADSPAQEAAVHFLVSAVT